MSLSVVRVVDTPRQVLAPALLVLMLCLALTAGCTASGSTFSSDHLTVAAAANVQFAFEEMGRRFEEETGATLTFVYSSTGTLAQQLENGAPYDLLVAADTAHIEHLETSGLLLRDSSRIYAQGRIVLAVNQASGLQVTALVDLRNAGSGLIAIANPAHAPYGLAAQQALVAAGVWEDVVDRLVLAENVRQSLQFVQTGDAPVGIVARAIADVPEVSYTVLPASLHAPITQSMAVTASARNPALGMAFIGFVTGVSGQQILKRYGYLVPGEF